MTVYAWDSALAPQQVSFSLRGMTLGGPPTLTGRNQVAQSDAGYWVARLAGVHAVVPSEIRALRALRGKLEGGAHQVRVPVFDDDQAPWPAAGGRAANAFAEQAYSDGTLHTDGHGFYKPAIVVATNADAALRATSISFTITTAGTTAEGMFFSIGDRLHLLKELLSQSGSSRTYAIAPPLREAVPSGSRMNFENPVCRMRLLSEAEADLVLERGLYGFTDIGFIEVP